MSNLVFKITNDGRLDFGSEFNKSRVRLALKKNAGLTGEIVIRNKPSKNMRGYFEGGLVPAFCHWHDALDPLNPRHCAQVRRFLKYHFCSLAEKDLVSGKIITTPVSTASLNKAQFAAFIEKIVDYFIEQGIPIPNPEMYKSWRDSAPPPSERYWDWLQVARIDADAMISSPIQIEHLRKQLV